MTQFTIKKTAVALALVGALAACDSGDKTEKSDKAGDVKVEAKKAEFNDMYEKAAYSMGVNFSKQMATNFDSLKEFDIEIDKDLVVEGMRDGFAGTAQFDDEEVKANINAFQTELNEKMKQQQAELAAEAKKAAEENLKVGQEFQAEYAKKEGVTTTESGLMYRVIEDAEGTESPTAEDAVRVHYRGTFIDGKEFDSSYSRNKPIDFNLNGVIPGWTEGVQYMTVGDKYEFVIPADLAYGENDRAQIPGNSTLIFDVELLAINPTEPYKAPEQEASVEEKVEAAAEAVEEKASEAADEAKAELKELKEKAEEEVKEATGDDQ